MTTLPLEVSVPTLEIVTIGNPVPQGSKLPVMRGGRPSLVDDNDSKLRPWRRDITLAMLSAMRREQWATLTTAVSVRCDFYLERPATVSKHRLWPHVRPDVDKLARACLDAITTGMVRKITKDDLAVGAIHDDALVVELIARKRYAQPGSSAGVRITIRPALELVS